MGSRVETRSVNRSTLAPCCSDCHLTGAGIKVGANYDTFASVEAGDCRGVAG